MAAALSLPCRWVMLKNVHLAPGWLMQLEKKLHSLQPHACFRLFLTMEIDQDGGFCNCLLGPAGSTCHFVCPCCSLSCLCLAFCLPLSAAPAPLSSAHQAAYLSFLALLWRRQGAWKAQGISNQTVLGSNPGSRTYRLFLFGLIF